MAIGIQGFKEKVASRPFTNLLGFFFFKHVIANLALESRVIEVRPILFSTFNTMLHVESPLEAE